MEKSYYKSPIGILEIICENNELISLKLVNKIENTEKETDFIKNIKSQLNEYFLGKRKHFDIKINPKGSVFQKNVWKELQKIPYGTTRSYSETAEKTGNKNAQRAVGSACNKNPIIIIIPCHRVISKNKKIGGFACGANIKRKLLKIENYN
jgi:methylated-DNA-[protein]-cysteine S-methyltransferase